MQTDMTAGKPAKMILNFTIPVFMGNVFQQFYNMADAIIVGKFVGTKGLAAVGSTGTIMFLIIGFLMGLTAGFTVLTSQKFGAGKMDEMRQSVGNAAILSVLISVIMTAVSMVGMRSLLAYTCRYFSGCLCLYYDHLRRNFCPGVIQYPGKYPPCTGKQQNAPVFPDPGGCFKYCAGPGIYYCISYGCGRGSLGNCYSPGCFWTAVPGIYHKMCT